MIYPVYFFGGIECVGQSFDYFAHIVFLRDVRFRTQRDDVASRSATNLATHLPRLATPLSHPSPSLSHPYPSLSHPSPFRLTLDGGQLTGLGVTALVDLAVGPVAHHLYQVEDPRRVLTHTHNLKSVLWIRIRIGIRLLGSVCLDLLVTCTDPNPAPDSYIIKQK